ncbi:MAG: UbiA family prenyltransferase [Anaerolineae bacterium]|nr:UbiA family prenyltransferase [Anaerolineae bacterium]
MSALPAALLRLTRWPEHVPFTLAATLLGANMAAHHAGAALDGRVLTALAANALAVTFAFMVNDLADAPDDARDPARAARNAVASGALAARTGWAASGIVAGLALALYAALPAPAALTGGATLLLGLLYSWRPVRLKARPLLDVIAHLLMLSALLVLAGYLAFDAAPGRAWWVVAAAGLISAYGQLYNQVRDDAQDRAAGLRNTTALLGAARARMVMHACLGAAGLLLALTVLLGLWPLWLGAVLAALAVPVLLWRRGTDMRGTAAIDASGRLQLGAMLAACAAMIAWLLVNVWG